MSRVDALGLLANLVFLARLMPQPVRLARRTHVAGVSSLAALHAVTAALAWSAYGLDRRLPFVWVVSVLALVPSLWQVALLRRSVTQRDLRGATWFAFALVVAWRLGVFGLALSTTAAVTLAPQVRLALASNDLSGLAPATWWLAVADASVWGLYGLAIGDWALLGYAAVLTTSAVVVLGRIAWTSRQVDRRPRFGQAVGPRRWARARMGP